MKLVMCYSVGAIEDNSISHVSLPIEYSSKQKLINDLEIAFNKPPAQSNCFFFGDQCFFLKDFAIWNHELDNWEYFAPLVYTLEEWFDVDKIKSPEISLVDAHITMFRRYEDLLKSKGVISVCSNEKPTELPHLFWMCETMVNNLKDDDYPLDKASRWLGYVQGCLVMKGMLNVDEERDFSRPLFSPHYKIK